MGDKSDRKQIDAASAWFESAVEEIPDPRWVPALMHACMEKSLISDWDKDGTVVFTKRALDENWRKKALNLAKEMYDLIAGGIDMERGRYT